MFFWHPYLLSPSAKCPRIRQAVESGMPRTLKKPRISPGIPSGIHGDIMVNIYNIYIYCIIYNHILYIYIILYIYNIYT